MINSEILEKISELKTNLVLDKKEAVQLYKEQIVPILDMDISGRYYYDTGQIVSMMRYDEELREAKNLLSNKDKYSLLLSEIND